MSVWDNGYGISVPRQLQTVNNSISKALSGFQSEQDHVGIEIYQVESMELSRSLRSLSFSSRTGPKKSQTSSYSCD